MHKSAAAIAYSMAKDEGYDVPRNANALVQAEYLLVVADNLLKGIW